jgi:hypothetical protein
VGRPCADPWLMLRPRYRRLMNIEGTGRFVFYAQWPVAVFLPVFFFVGRGNVGAEVGWLGFFGIV